MESQNLHFETVPCPVVGIGTSAGGFTALKRLFNALPEQPGVALIVVRHQDPSHQSQLAQIMSTWTRLPVRFVMDGERIRANHVYVASPGRSVTFEAGVLRSRPALGRRRGSLDSIDRLFDSLAPLGTRAAAVLLSGTGSDGAVGAAQIKAAGGVVLAQAPETAEFSEMPVAAIRAGLANHSLPPEGIARDLALLATPHRLTLPEFPETAELETLEEILALIRIRAGLDLRGYKAGTTLRLVRRRMQRRGLQRWSEFAELLRRDPRELEALARDVFIHVTMFFRDEESWLYLEREVIGRIFEECEGPPIVRAWTAACSTGEEAYSLGMLLMERAEATPGADFQLFATDVAPHVIARARRGVYPPEALATVSAERRERFFETVTHGYRVRNELRHKLVFAPHNLLADPPFSKLDLVTCRNMLIYLEKPAKARALSLLAHALHPGGRLFVGDSERITDETPGLEPVSSIHGVWQKRVDARDHRLAPSFMQLARSGAEELAASQEELHAVNDELGTVNTELNLVNAQLAEVNLELRARIAELQTQGEVLSSGGVAALFLDSQLRLQSFADLAGAVWPFQATDVGRSVDEINPKVSDPHFLDDARAALSSASAMERETPARDGRVWLRRMGPRLGEDGAPEGVAVTYVDVTALRVAEAALREREGRLRTVLEGIGEAFYALDAEWHFLFASRTALELWGKTAEDVLGRPFLECFPSAAGSALDEAHQRVLRTGTPERLVTISPVIKRWIEVDIAPMPVGGLCGAFRDIDARKRAEDALRESERHFRAFVTASSSVVYRMSPDWSEMRLVESRDLVADPAEPFRDWLNAYVPVDDQPLVLAAMGRAIQTKTPFELEHRIFRADGEIGWVHSRAVPLLDDTGAIVEWFGAAHDVTRRREAEEQLRVSDARYRRLFDSIDEGFCVIEVLFDEAGRPADYRFIEVNAAFEGQTGLKDAAGKTMRQLEPAHDAHWFEIYGRIAITGEPKRFEAPAAALGRDYDVYAFRFDDPALHRVGILFKDISARRPAR